jgi:leucyl/phenylalanyl-tRNA--protein transferase
MLRSIPLDPQTLLAAYAQGAFPMADPDGRISFYTADPRGVMPLQSFHVSQTLRQLVKKSPSEGGFDVRINHDFQAAMRGCMEARADGTWINEELIAAYVRLHRLGHAHSVECYKDNVLAGGLYGVSLGAAFFGESMFHRVRDASKVAMVHLVRRLTERNFELLDTQAVTSHLRRFGCIEVPADEYLVMLQAAIKKPRTFAD